MAQEINLGGTIYISSKRAAEITGYTQDYIGQLARGGQIIAQRVSGLWYVVEESLRNYKSKADEFKPTPPAYTPPEQKLEASVSFDGRDYVSTQRAAEITGYHADYVSQLARNGKILSRQVGNRWFVDREAIVEHKKHNDALLAAVQAESVGLQKDLGPTIAAAEPGLHFSYTPKDEAKPTEYLPEIKPKDEIPATPIDDSTHAFEAPTDDVGPEEINEIPIRVIRSDPTSQVNQPQKRLSSPSRSVQPSRVMSSVIIGSLIGVVVLGAGYLYTFERASVLKSYISLSDMTASATNKVLFVDSLTVPQFVLDLLANELYFRRDSF